MDMHRTSITTICKPEHGAGNILGGCAHRDMEAPYIERHNAAGSWKAQDICNGAHGNDVMIGVVGNAEKCQGLEVCGSRIPEWLLSDQDCDRVDSDRSMMI